jgi:ribosomal protein S18 acetylase RimI-like enzyme
MNFVDNALSYRLESAEWLPTIAIIEGLKRNRPGSAAERMLVSGGWVMYAEPNSPMNHAIGMGLQGPVSDAEFDAVEEFYRSGECVCEIVASPYADLSLFAHLGARGYTITEWNSVLMRRLGSDEQFDRGGVDVRRAGPGDASDYSSVLARGFGHVVGPEVFLPMLEAPNAICFVASVDSMPAGAAGGSAHPDAGLASLYGAATLPEFRNRGIQNALFQARLKAAAEAGCEIASVCTQPGTTSQRNAERNGFRLAYTKAAFQRRW